MFRERAGWNGRSTTCRVYHRSYRGALKRDDRQHAESFFLRSPSGCQSQRTRSFKPDTMKLFHVLSLSAKQAALDAACAPPMTEEFAIDSEEWSSISASVYLTKRGDVFVVALEAGSGSNSGSGNLPRTPPSPATVRSGGDGAGGTCIGSHTRVVAAWATATITNPDVPARLTLMGLKPECDYELYAYAENGAGRRRADGNEYGGGTDDIMFCVEPAPAGMSTELVASTHLAARTAQEPDEELDVPWEDLSESEKMVEALAALNDPAVARAAREAALDVPRTEDLAKCEADPVSRNKWRSFFRWWAGGIAAAGCSDERKAFLLRECVFAAQQPQVRPKRGSWVEVERFNWKPLVAFCHIPNAITLCLKP